MNLFDGRLYGVKIMNPMDVAKIDTTMEMPKKKNPLVIYHANCADGFSAAWCFHNVKEKMGEFDFHPGVYNDPPPDVTDRVVYLVDFSYKRAVVEEMLKTARHIYLIDHHKTAIEDILGPKHPQAGHINAPMPANFTMYCDLERSGAMLAWDFLHNTSWLTHEEGLARIHYQPGDSAYVAPPLLLGHVQDRDLWRFKLPGTREISAAMFSYEYTFENWDDMMLGDFTYADGSTPAQMKALSDLKTQGEAIERKHNKDIKELVNACRRYTNILDFNVPIASLPHFMSSDAGHLMAKEHENGTLFAACYWDTATHRIFSLRSTDGGVDVADVAKQFGGGGHSRAAGFRVLRDHALARI